MTDYSWPTDLAPFAQAYWLQPHVGRSESPFTRQMKTYGLSAPRWVTRMSFRGGYAGATAEAAFGGRIDALLVKLAGGVHRALIYDFRRPTNSGPGRSLIDMDGLTFPFAGGEHFSLGEMWEIDWSTEPQSLAAAAGATSITFDGFEPQAIIFKAGDYVGGDGRAHLILDDATADVTGRVTVSFQPPLGGAIAAGAGIYERVTSPFRLVSDAAGANPAEAGEAVALDFELIEDL